MRSPQIAAFGAALILSLTGAASASANEFHVAPDANRAQTPCTTAQPCSLAFGLNQAFEGDEVVMRAGSYDHHGADPLAVRPGVELHGVPGKTRPLIVQTVPYRDCQGCRVVDLAHDAVLRDVDVTQLVEGGGALRATAASTVERSALRARSNALRLTGVSVPAPSGGVREVLAVASHGTAIISEQGQTAVKYLENVTAIGQGSAGIGISVVAEANTDDTLDAVNTIARGTAFDIEVSAKPWGSPQGAGIDDVASMTMRYGNYRGDRVRVEGSDPAWPNARLDGFDHNIPDDPEFVSDTDFHLQKGSTSIDNGRVHGLFGSLDLDGGSRAFNGTPDIGAYEWHPAPVIPGKKPDKKPETKNPDTKGPDTRNPDDRKPPVAFTGLALPKQSVKVKRGVAAVRVECPAAQLGPCAGTLTLKSGRTKVGAKRFATARGGSAVVRVKLTKKGRRLIARKRKLGTSATATTVGAPGQRAQAKAKVTLKLAKPRKRRR
jgi:hypothetical protein